MYYHVRDNNKFQRLLSETEWKKIKHFFSTELYQLSFSFLQSLSEADTKDKETELPADVVNQIGSKLLTYKIRRAEIFTIVFRWCFFYQNVLIFNQEKNKTHSFFWIESVLFLNRIPMLYGCTLLFKVKKSDFSSFECGSQCMMGTVLIKFVIRPLLPRRLSKDPVLLRS